MNGESKNSLKSDILEAVTCGRVKMRPKWHFLLKTGLVAAGGMLVLLTLLYVASLIIFMLEQSGVWFVPVFGAQGWIAFLGSLPWLLIAVVLVFIAILEVLVQQFAFAYQRPMLYSALAILMIVTVGGFLVAAAGVHRRISRYAENNRLLIAGPFYHDAGRKHVRDIHRGRILATSSRGFVMQSRPGTMLTIIMSPHTRLPYGTDFMPGDWVVVFGPSSATSVQAFGVREVFDESE